MDIAELILLTSGTIIVVKGVRGVCFLHIPERDPFAGNILLKKCFRDDSFAGNILLKVFSRRFYRNPIPDITHTTC